MKKNFPLILLIVSNTSLYSLGFTTCTHASEHLIEVNPEWKNYTNLLEDEINFLIDFNNEKERIQFHFNHVIYLLKKNSFGDKSSSQNKKRNKLLETLQAYADLGVFPTNNYHNKRQPYFIDEDQKLCAVAHLLEFDNQVNLIDLIQKEKNNHFIKDMKINALLEWGKTQGFSENELALIQPGYPVKKLVWSDWGNGIGLEEGKVNVMKVNEAESMLYIAGDFESFDGEAGNKIIAFDGETYHSLGDGLEGQILDLAFYEEKVIVGGDLYYQNNKVNLLYWNGSEWFPMTNDFNGIVYTIEIFDNKLFVGGDFNSINGSDYAYLAYYDFISEEWSNKSTDGVEGAFSVNGIVRDIDLHTFYDSLVIAGDFTVTGNLTDSELINSDSCTHLSVWLGDNWKHSYQGDFTPLHHIQFSYYHCVSGDGTNSKSAALRRVNDPSWNYISEDGWEIFQPYPDTTITKILEVNNGYPWIYGSFHTLTFNPSLNLAPLHISISDQGIETINGTIQAMAQFKSEYYMIGEFTNIDGYEFKGLAKTNGTLPVQEIPELELKVYSSLNSIYIEGAMEEKAKLRLVNESGQEVFTTSLQPNQNQQEIGLGNLSDGIYFYQIQIGQDIIADKLVVING